MAEGRITTPSTSIADVVQTEEAHVLPADWLAKFLNSGSSIEMNVDGSDPVVKFKYTVPANRCAVIRRVNWAIEDATVKMPEFGGISALTNGLLVQVIDTDTTTVVLDFLDGNPIKQNFHFALLAGSDVDIERDTGNVNETLFVRWSLYKGGGPLFLAPGQIFQVTVQDDLTGLDAFHASLQGQLYDYN